MNNTNFFIAIGSLIIALLTGGFIGYNSGVNDTSFNYRQQIKLDMLKDNLDKNYVFEGTLSYFGQEFYVNKDNLLQIDSFNDELCNQLSQEGYNCNSGVLITNFSIDPIISGQETLTRAKEVLKDAKETLESSNETLRYSNEVISNIAKKEV